MNITEIVFLCDARNIHAIDWYKIAKNEIKDFKISILTDIVKAEGKSNIIKNEDNIYKLLMLNSLLFSQQSSVAHLWRNLIKFIFFPLQIFFVKKFALSHPTAVYYTHSMYYLFLAWASNVPFIGVPQGSNILIKTKKSFFYKWITIKSLKSAKAITCDSESMKKRIYELSGVEAHIIQNGIDIKQISKVVKSLEVHRTILLSIRGFTSLYRIRNIVEARNVIFNSVHSISFVYPFCDIDYLNSTYKLLTSNDKLIGTLSRENLYNLLLKTKVVFSIPSSDSSPRSVYESIFCGAVVVINYNAFYDSMPNCMKARVIIVDLNNKNWFYEAIIKADEIIKKSYIPSLEALHNYDQIISINKVKKIFLDCF
jgi:hypothetical protein